MHVTELQIQNLPPFTEPVNLELDERVNLLVGPNATGKSTILRMLQSRTDRIGNFLFWVSDDWYAGEHPDYFTKDNTTQLPWIYIPATRHNLPLSQDVGAMSSLQASRWHILDDSEADQSQSGIVDSLKDALYTFNGDTVRRACKAMTDLSRSGHDAESVFLQKQSVKLVAYACTQSICNDLLIDGNEPLDFVHHQPMRGSTYSITNVYDDMAVNISRSEQTPTFIGDLSSGTQGTLLWIWYLAFRVADFYRYEPGWHDKPAVLMIDEIENHLHPTWQRRVIASLLTYFKGLQMFATSHSPFVVAGLERGQVHKLYREGNVVKALEIPEERRQDPIVGWAVEDILREFMDVDDPTDADTAEAAAVLRWLRRQDVGEGTAEAWKQATMVQLERKDVLTRDERASMHWLGRQGELQGGSPQWWQETIDELSGRVSRELEAGGPIAAQRELFLSQLAEMMDDN